jgi:MFS family permease
VKTLQITILWFAFFTFLSGFTSNFEQLLVTRSLQGLGFGGEWATGSVLIGEVISARHRGKAVGLVQSGWAVGWGAAALLSTVFFLLLPEEVAWRVLFFVGLLPALLALWVRRLIPESPLFVRARAAGEGRTHWLEIFRPAYLSITVRGCLLALGIHGGYYAVATWLPTYLRTERQLSILTTGGYLAVIIAGSMAGYLVAAHLNDWWGRRKTFLLFAFAALAIALSYTRFAISNELMLFLGFPLGFFASGIYSGLGPLFTELYPTHIRGSGQGFCFNFGRGIAAGFPVLVGAMSERLGLGPSVSLFAALAYGIAIIATLLLPETKGRELHVLQQSPLTVDNVR